jgi:MFS family permease
MLIGAAHTGPVLAFQTLWGGPYLYGGFGVDAAVAGRFLLALSLGVSTGYASSGALADRFGLRRVTLLSGVAFAAVQGALAAVVPGVTPLAWVLPLYALLGFTGGFCVLALSNARALLGVTRSGRATGIVNGASIGGVFAMQWGIGLVVEAAGGADGFRLALLGTGTLTLAATLLHAWARARVDRGAARRGFVGDQQPPPA